jgi:hypothetical protein
VAGAETHVLELIEMALSEPLQQDAQDRLAGVQILAHRQPILPDARLQRQGSRATDIHIHIHIHAQALITEAIELLPPARALILTRRYLKPDSGVSAVAAADVL